MKAKNQKIKTSMIYLAFNIICICNYKLSSYITRDMNLWTGVKSLNMKLWFTAEGGKDYFYW